VVGLTTNHKSILPSHKSLMGNSFSRICYRKTWISTLVIYQLKLITSPNKYFLFLWNNLYEFLGTNYCINKRWSMVPLQLSLPPLAQTSSYVTGDGSPQTDLWALTQGEKKDRKGKSFEVPVHETCAFINLRKFVQRHVWCAFDVSPAYLAQTVVKCAREKQAVREQCFFRLVCLVLIARGSLFSLELFGEFMHELL